MIPSPSLPNVLTRSVSRTLAINYINTHKGRHSQSRLPSETLGWFWRAP